ncbi:HAD family hydrolase [Acetobacter okinawensis]|uniref:HAD family hydrolase n=1 Tax=Acetobacter okinawensis TaxID=1076594 RepID=UPI0004728514|nr:HAD-IA family hydrolase [Acetobacter okinawensis]
MMSPTTLIFDLDGTLIDSALVVADILNEMRVERGMSPLDIASYRLWSSLGGTTLVGNALGIDPAQAADRVVEFRRRYHLRPTPAESLFPTTRQTLTALAAKGYTMAICSNKPASLCAKVLRETDLADYFDVVIGGDTLPRSKPDPAPLQHALAELGVPSDAALMIGDSSVDQRTAAAANVRFVFFTPGYDDGVDRKQAFRTIDQLSELETVLV